MPRCNAGGGRHNQNNNDPTVPRRAMFSNFGNKGGGKGGGKGGKDGKGERDGKGKGKRPTFETQKEMDKWKGAQKGKSANAATSAAGKDSTENANDLTSIWKKKEIPSYVHGTVCLTHDDHVVLEPLLTPPVVEGADTAPSRFPFDIAEEASEQLSSLGFLQSRIKPALEVVAPQLMWELEDRELPLTARAVAERALEWLCCVTEERELPSKLRETREVSGFRRKQEERNVSFQSRSLNLDNIESTDITRIEKLGFSRAKAIEALSKAPNHDLIPAVKSLLSAYLPLDVSVGPEDVPSTREDLMDECEALTGAYGEEAVVTLAGSKTFEVSVALPETEWRIAAMIPEGLPYPHSAPLLCPKHPRLREAARPRLLKALGDVSREVLGGPMLFTLCEWLVSEGERYLVRAGSEEAASPTDGKAFGSGGALSRSLEESERRRQQEEEEEKQKNSRIEFLKSLQEEEDKKKGKDKIALEILADPEAAAQHDLAGYDEGRAQDLVRQAFSKPLPSASGKMVRVSFVVGGGKAVRQKYSETLPKIFATALQDIGYTQDSSASGTWESAGTFKGQHDTQRNLKLVHVYPKMVKTGPGAEASVNETVEATHLRLSTSAWEDFLVEVTAWLKSRQHRQKAEALVPYLEDVLEDLQETDKKLQQGAYITEAQQRQYDSCGGPEDVSEKISWLKTELEHHSEAKKPLRPNNASASDATDGKTFAFDAPAGLAAAAAAAASVGGAGGGEGGAAGGGEADDESLLRRRVMQTKGENARLHKELLEQPKPLKEIREGLPAAGQKAAIQQALRNQQVIVIEGDTGCGKSTQVPQYILEDWVSHGEGGAANILMTQPRRISAIGVAERIAQEMDTPCGDLAGYSIRLESKKSARTKILVCTTGVVLRRLESDRLLRGVTHIVVDECHERDLDTDFLLIVLRDLLPKRPSLRVVLMSATINAQIFKDYFGSCQSIHIPGRTFPVTSYFLENALEHTGFVVEPNSEYSKRDAYDLMPDEVAELHQLYNRDEYQQLVNTQISRFVMEQMNRMDPEKINFDLVAAVVNHIHTQVDPPKAGKSTLGAILVFVPGLGEIKRCVRALSEDSGTSWKGSGGKDGSSKGGGKGSTTSNGLWVLPLHSMIAVAEQRLVFQRAAKGLRKVVVTTNIAETSITIDDVEFVVDCGRHKQTKYDPANRISMLVDCVETKANAKQRRGRAGRVRSGVCYHLLNVRKWRRLEDFEKPEMLRVPLDSLCLRISLLNLGHPARFLMKALTPPTEAAIRSSLQQLVELNAVEVMQRKGAEGIDPNDGTTWDKEEQERLLKAKLKLTPLGAHLASLPVDAGMGKLLVLGTLFGVPREVCVLAAALTTKSPFKAGVGSKRDQNDKRKLELASNFIDGGLESDHLLLFTLFERWEELGGKNSHAARTWCHTNELDSQTFESVAEMRSHLLGVLVEQGFISQKHAANPSRRKAYAQAQSQTESPAPEKELWVPPILGSVISATDEYQRRRRQLLRSLLCAALWPNVALKKENGGLFARNQTSLTFHPMSILGLQQAEAKEAESGDWNCPSCTFFCFGSRNECPQCWTPKPPPVPTKVRPIRHRAFVYGEKVRTVASASGSRPQTHIRDCCGISLKALFLLGHRVVPEYLAGFASVDGWVHCLAAPKDVAMLLGLRRRLQEVLARLLLKPSAEAPGGEDPDVIDAVTSMLVLDVE